MNRRPELLLAGLLLCSPLVLAQLTTAAAKAPAKSTIHRDSERRFQLTLPSRLTPSETPPKSEATLSLKGPAGLVASLTSFEAANRGAYRKNEREAFVDAIELGLQGSQTGYRRKSRLIERVNRVPVLDLSFERRTSAGRERVWMRFLFRYRFTVVATAVLPASARQGEMRQARAFTQGLVAISSP